MPIFSKIVGLVIKESTVSSTKLLDLGKADFSAFTNEDLLGILLIMMRQFRVLDLAWNMLLAAHGEAFPGF